MTTQRRKARTIAVILAAMTAAAAALVGPHAAYAATEAMTVNLASVRGTSTGVGQGLLHGVSQDATQPANRFIQPLRLNAFRGGGHASRGWIGDNYTYGTGTKADVAEAIAQAKRLNALSPSGIQGSTDDPVTIGTPSPARCPATASPAARYRPTSTSPPTGRQQASPPGTSPASHSPTTPTRCAATGPAAPHRT